MKRRKQFDAGKEARRRARESAPPIPAKRVIPDKRRKPAKHKPSFLDTGVLID